MFHFYKNNIKIESLKNDKNIEMNVINSFDKSIVIKYGENSITLLPCDNSEFVSTLETFNAFQITSLDDMVVIKYLFEKYGLMIYDEKYLNNVSYLDEEKDKTLYDNALRNYILDCMFYYGIIENERELGVSFVDDYFLILSHKVRYRRMKIDLIKKKIQLFSLKLVKKLKFW